MNTGEHYLVWVWWYFEDQKSVHFKIGVCCYGDGPLRVERRWLNGLSNDRLSQQDCDKQSFSQQSRSREEEILSLILCKFISIRRMNVIYSVVIATVLIDASSATASFATPTTSCLTHYQRLSREIVAHKNILYHIHHMLSTPTLLSTSIIDLSFSNFRQNIHCYCLNLLSIDLTHICCTLIPDYRVIHPLFFSQ